MKVRFFTVSIQDADAATGELNSFLSSHRVVHLERQFVADGANSVWSICVSYLDGGERPAPERHRGGPKVDYRDVLPEAQFALFAKLRTLRKELAEKEGVPPYALFNNEQLAEMARRSVSSLESLKQINGVGPSRVEKYGEAFLRLIRGHVVPPSNGEMGGGPNGTTGTGEP